jgi:NADH-quinone oxidoreductase subunit J
MAATLIVYAGAIVVTFLFVIMLAQQAGLSSADAHSHEAFLSALAGLVLLGVLAIILPRTQEEEQTFAALSPSPSATPEEEVARVRQLLQRTDQATGQTTIDALAAVLDDPELFREYRRLAESAPGHPDSRYLREKVREVEAGWQESWRREGDVPAARKALAELHGLGSRLATARDAQGRALMPAENVAALGRTLFTDYFLAVELGGALLLVAAVGAIAIAGQPTPRAR